MPRMKNWLQKSGNTAIVPNPGFLALHNQVLDEWVENKDKYHALKRQEILTGAATFVLRLFCDFTTQFDYYRDGTLRGVFMWGGSTPTELSSYPEAFKIDPAGQFEPIKVRPNVELVLAQMRGEIPVNDPSITAFAEA